MLSDILDPFLLESSTQSDSIVGTILFSHHHHCYHCCTLLRTSSQTCKNLSTASDDAALSAQSCTSMVAHSVPHRASVPLSGFEQQQCACTICLLDACRLGCWSCKDQTIFQLTSMDNAPRASDSTCAFSYKLVPGITQLPPVCGAHDGFSVFTDGNDYVVHNWFSEFVTDMQACHLARCK